MASVVNFVSFVILFPLRIMKLKKCPVQDFIWDNDLSYN
jgi:hypothetical protein